MIMNIDNTIKLSKFKYFEFQLDIEYNNCLAEWINLSIGTNTRCDHPRIYLICSFLRFIYFNMSIYDSRHYEEIYGDTS